MMGAQAEVTWHNQRRQGDTSLMSTQTTSAIPRATTAQRATTILPSSPPLRLAKQLPLLATLWALILAYVSAAQVFRMSVLRSFFAAWPEELFESARTAGTGDVVTLSRTASPLSGGTLRTLG